MLNCRTTVSSNSSAVQPVLGWLTRNKREGLRLPPPQRALAGRRLSPHSGGRRKMKKFALVLLLALCCNLSAHQNTVSFLFLEPKGNQIEGRYDISVRNLDFLLGLDNNS